MFHILTSKYLFKRSFTDMLSNFSTSESNKMNVAIPELSLTFNWILYLIKEMAYIMLISYLVIMYFNIKSKHFHCVPWDWEACLFFLQLSHHKKFSLDFTFLRHTSQEMKYQPELSMSMFIIFPWRVKIVS